MNANAAKVCRQEPFGGTAMPLEATKAWLSCAAERTLLTLTIQAAFVPTLLLLHNLYM
jgi:hypothetical protein